MRAGRSCLCTLIALIYVDCALAEALTVSDAIETTRFVPGIPKFATVTPSGQFFNSGPIEAFVSPDKKLWATMLVRGDVERNGNWAEVVVSGLESLQSASQTKIVARFFTDSLGDGGLGDPPTLARANRQPLQWLPDSLGVALLWTDEANKKQIFRVDAHTGKISQLSKHPTSIIGFASGGKSILYLAEDSAAAGLPNAQPDPRKGVTIETRFLPNALVGEVGGEVQGWYNFKWYLLDSSTGETRDIAGLSVSRYDWAGATFSKDGRFAIVEASPEVVPQAWERYRAPYWSPMIELARKDRNDGLGRQLMQLYAVDVQRARARPLWDAPGKVGSTIAWSPDGRSVALSPTFVPVSRADDAGLTGYATGVIELESGRFKLIPITPESPLAAASLRWMDGNVIEMQDGDHRYVFRASKGDWTTTATSSDLPSDVSRDEIGLHIEEDMNTPPVLVGTDRRNGQRRVIFDPNPQLKNKFSLGKVQMISWKDSSGRTWVGRLFYPVDWRFGHRYPLVIQTAGYASSDSEKFFTLYGIDIGPGLGPGVSILAAQPLASRGIMVLSVERKSDQDIVANGNDAPVHAEAYEAAIDHLDRMGLIDKSKVGISGYSNTGYLVQYALVHSTFRYAAAITDDNYDGSYFQAVTTGSKQYAHENGAEPYGDGLQLWLQRAPGFNVDKIRTPLRLQATSPPPASILASWEIFTRLRELGKPVEFFLIPQIDRGNHSIQNPGQCLASQEGAVDWFDFWLNGREEPNSEKSDQYARWRGLRAASTPSSITERGQN